MLNTVSKKEPLILEIQSFIGTPCSYVSPSEWPLSSYITQVQEQYTLLLSRIQLEINLLLEKKGLLIKDLWKRDIQQKINEHRRHLNELNLDLSSCTVESVQLLLDECKVY